MVKMCKAAWDIIKRLPYREQIQASKALCIQSGRDVATAVDVIMMASMLYHIEHDGYGTREGSVRLKRYVAGVQSIVDTNCDYYDDAVAEGLRNRLHNLGIDYGR